MTVLVAGVEVGVSTEGELEGVREVLEVEVVFVGRRQVLVLAELRARGEHFAGYFLNRSGTETTPDDHSVTPDP